MREYRLVVVLKSDIKKETKDSLFADFQRWIGTVSDAKTNSLGDRKLAYPIKKQRTGEYVVMNFKADTVATDLNAQMNRNENVLRYLLVRE